MTKKTQQLTPMGCSKSSSKREAYSNTILPQETRKTSNRQPNFIPKTTGKRRRKNSEVSRRKVKVQVSQSCPTLCSPIHYTVHGILQARILEWVAFPFSRGSSQPRDQTRVSYIAGRIFINWAIREACRRRKKIIKIWAEINEKEVKETIVKINKTKSWFFEMIKLTNP